MLIVDDTALLKQGTHSVGVARQCGKTANCQTFVSLTLARGEVPVCLALRLFLPAEWTDEPACCRAVGVPEARLVYHTKGEIALEEIDRVCAAPVSPSAASWLTPPTARVRTCECGLSPGLSARGCTWAMGVPKIQKVYPADVQLRMPRTKPGVGHASIPRRHAHV